MDEVPLEIRDLDAEIKNEYSENGLKILTRLDRGRYGGDVRVGVNTIYFEEEYPSKIHLVRDLDDSINWIGVGPTDDRNKEGKKDYRALDFFLRESKDVENNYIISMDKEVGERLGYKLKILKEMEDFERREVVESLGLKNTPLTIKSNKIPFFIDRREEKRRTTDDGLDFVKEVLEEYKEKNEKKYETRLNTLDICLSRSCTLTCKDCEECSLLFNQV